MIPMSILMIILHLFITRLSIASPPTPASPLGRCGRTCSGGCSPPWSTSAPSDSPSCSPSPAWIVFPAPAPAPTYPRSISYALSASRCSICLPFLSAILLLATFAAPSPPTSPTYSTPPPRSSIHCFHPPFANFCSTLVPLPHFCSHCSTLLLPFTFTTSPLARSGLLRK